MKKTIIVTLAILLLGVFGAKAQHDKGTIMVGARTTNFELTFGDETKFNLGAHGGYFIMKNLMVGGLFSVGSKSYDGGHSSSEFKLMPLGRYYFLEQGKGSLFGEAGFGFTKITNLDVSIDMSLAAGYSYLFTKNIAAEPFVRLELPFSSGYKTTFGLGASIALYF